MARTTDFRGSLAAMSEHWQLTAWLLLALILLSVIGGVTATSIASSAAKSVCFAHHSPVECDPSLRIKTPEELARLSEMYLQCLKDHVGYSSVCQPIYYH